MTFDHLQKIPTQSFELFIFIFYQLYSLLDLVLLKLQNARGQVMLYREEMILLHISAV